MLLPIAFSTVLSALPIALPGGPPVVMDYLAFDAPHGRLWVPAGNTGRVDVIDVASGKVNAVDGFATAPSKREGRPPVGPSSATVAGDVVWVGSRADKRVCAIDAKSLQKKDCVALREAPDGIAWVPTTGELWATTPADGTLTIINKGGQPATLKLPGEPEGYAVDAQRGLFYTNLEDKDRTLVVDVKKRAVVSDWPAGCGEGGPRGLAIDTGRRLLFVACTHGANALDLQHDGKIVGKLETGGGVDNIDYVPSLRRLYVASGKDGALTIASVDDKGALKAVDTAPTGPGARVVVTSPDGTAWVADSQNGRIVKVPAQR